MHSAAEVCSWFLLPLLLLPHTQLPLSFSPMSSMGGVGGCGHADVSGTIHYQLNSMITTFFDNKNNDRITSDKIHFDNWISTFQSHLCTF